MGSNIGKDEGLCSVVTEAVKEVAKVPVWTKLTPATQDIVVEAAACFRGGADAIVSSNTFPSLPIIDPETLEFEINVDGLVSSGGLGGPAILPMSLANMARMCQAFPDRAFSGIGGVSDFAQALSYFLLGAGTVQVCTAAMLDSGGGSERDQAVERRARCVPRAACGKRMDERRRLPWPASGSRRGAIADQTSGGG